MRAEVDLNKAPRELVAAEAALNRVLADWRYRERWSDAWFGPAQLWSELVWQRAVECGPLPLAPDTIAAGRRVAAAPVYICGAPRSGTTLLRDLLDGHPALAVLPSEGKFFKAFVHGAGKSRAAGFAEHAKNWLRLLANPNHQQPFWLLGRGDTDDSDYVRFARALLSWNAVFDEDCSGFALQPTVALSLAISRHQDVAALARSVDKSPGYEFHLPAIWARNPDAKVIHLLRDPAEIAASFLRGTARNKLAAISVPRLLRNVTSSYGAARRAQHFAPPEGFLVVRYEELVADRRREMARVASFLGIEWDESLLQQTILGLPAEPNSSFHGLERDSFTPAGVSQHLWLAIARHLHHRTACSIPKAASTVLAS